MSDSDTLNFIVAAVVIGLLPAFIARSRGHSFFGWWIFGMLLFIVAFPCSLFLKRDYDALEERELNDSGMKKCQFCAELVKEEAIVCRYCGRDIVQTRRVM